MFFRKVGAVLLAVTSSLCVCPKPNRWLSARPIRVFPAPLSALSSHDEVDYSPHPGTATGTSNHFFGNVATSLSGSTLPTLFPRSLYFPALASAQGLLPSLSVHSRNLSRTLTTPLSYPSKSFGSFFIASPAQSAYTATSGRFTLLRTFFHTSAS